MSMDINELHRRLDAIWAVLAGLAAHTGYSHPSLPEIAPSEPAADPEEPSEEVSIAKVMDDDNSEEDVEKSDLPHRPAKANKRRGKVH